MPDFIPSGAGGAPAAHQSTHIPGGSDALQWTASKVLLGAGTGTDPTEIALGTLSATCVVIANDAKSEVKTWGGILQDAGHPVWVCDATSDDVQVQAAIDALPT